MANPANRDKTIQSLEDDYLKMVMGEGTEKGAPKTTAAADTATPDPATPAQVFSVIIGQELMTAFLRAPGRKPITITKGEFLEEIARHGVVYGIDHEGVERAVRHLQTTGGWQGDLLIARGTPPEEQQPPRFTALERRIDSATGLISWASGPHLLDFITLKKTLALKNMEAVRTTSCLVKAAAPNELIAVIGKTRTATPGCNVHGQPVLPETGITAGDNVRFSTKDGSLRATIHGYLLIEGNVVSVLPPIWITPDRMTAYYVNLPQAGTPILPSVSELESLLRLKAVTEVCIRDEILQEAVTQLVQPDCMDRLVPIATGSPPVPGENASFTFFFAPDARPGTQGEGDFFDLRERHLIASVREKTLIAEKKLASRGIKGLTLFGEKIDSADGKDVLVTFDDGVVAEKKTDRILYYARKNGVVSYQAHRLSVIDLFKVDGDVDFATGNIDVTTAVSVTGSVSPGFTVKAVGNIYIHGTVEVGATVVAHGNLTVAGGIVGETTKIIVGGTLRASTIQGAAVIAKGDIVVETSIYSASIRCGGTVTVLKGQHDRGGKIIDGFVSAAKGINAAAVGSMASQNTILALQNTPEDLLAMEKISSEAKQCAENILKLTRTLQIDSIVPDKIKALIAAAPPGKKEILVRVLQALNNLIKQRETIAKQEREWHERLDRELRTGLIRVTGTFYQGNTVQIGDKKFVAPTDLSPAVFQLKDDVITS